jgi:pSer/pThr/pTyr-binding forkhead associated (FHA) protein
MNQTRYALVMLDEPTARFPLAGSVTIGRHLDNDLVIGGEDMRDFHVRIDTSERGPRVIALGAGTVHVNHAALTTSAGMKPGDELVLGHHRLRLVIESDESPCRWKLFRVGDADGVSITDGLRVGRANDCNLRLMQGHISRRHAQLDIIDGTVWLSDLDSSNGTFVNGERVQGAWRVFHGDEIAFDTMRYQLIGDGEDLTPIRPPGEPPDQLRRVLPPEHPDEPVPSGADTAAVPRAEDEPVEAVPELAPLTGPALRALSGPFAGRVFPLGFGRHLLGRSTDAAIYLPEASVSLRHAELDLKPDGAQLINLISTNGTWVNGIETHTARLRDGDLIRLGRVTLQFCAPVAAETTRRRWLWSALTVLLFGVFTAIVVWQFA